ncbi:uracil-DNA glycosylase [Candidatus Campbellbacteria bacterium]|nr:MAG: uracil-DNA glycosylase [Candidatus Campbellbacteria bacterium]
MSGSEISKIERMREVCDALLHFTQSPLYEYRTHNNYFPVIGEGSHDAHIMFIGEAPGKNEAKTGKPFCGAAGKILDELLAHIGLDRSTVYVTNIVKDRPPENRDPTPQEIELYGPFLDRQIEILQPKVIATLGRFSMAYVMGRLGLQNQIEPISKAHGKRYTASVPYGPVDIVPLYHPASALYSRALLPTHKTDIEILKTYL